MGTPLLLDTDIGSDVDDAIALAFAALDPRCALLAVTTVNGEAGRRARMARGLLDLIGRPDVVVGAGAEVGLGDTPNPWLPLPLGHDRDGTPGPGEPFPSARAVIHSVLEAATEPVAIAAVGAVTNVAAALAERPDLCRRVQAVHVMGGCFGPVVMGDAAGTMGSPHDEFNLGCDPVAAAVLFALPVAIRLVPIDVTMPLFLHPADRAAIRAAGPLGRELDEQAELWLDLQRTARGRDRASGLAQVRLHDPLTVVGIVDPAVETTEQRLVAVAGPPQRTRTYESRHGRPVTVVRTADGARLRRTLIAAIESALP